MSAARRVLITGAGSGLGRELALRFAAAGDRVMVTDRRADAAQQVADEITASGGAVLFAELDVRSMESFEKVLTEMRGDWGGIDVLINNAGVATAGAVADTPLEQWQWAFDINLMGCVRGAKAATPIMMEQRSGHIVNIASFAGIANPPAMASYNATKAATISLSETLRLELASYGIGITVACPSFFKTKLLETGDAQDEVRSAAPQVESIVRHLMDKATVTASDVARDVYQAVESGQFLVISHADARSQARLKRWAPETYFRMALKSTAAFLQR